PTATSTPASRTPPTTMWPPRSASWRAAPPLCSPLPAKRPTSSRCSTSAPAGT
ncbi:Chorion class high-cysteine HCB protein 13, partial [Dysosmobacter welbionis]